jgi:lipopolysaccharide transport system ATP-binding protein
MRPAIRVENLSKRYRIGGRPNGQYRTLRESIAEAASGPWKRLRALGREKVSNGDNQVPDRPEEFWALKDVSFEVEPGEVVGIIGRNGAGKSTLLKILSRITEPTRGRAELRGRIGSLLEVGTGFHPELTGRENICLNGSILGMSRHEVARKFDEIVAFSEIEQFLDTPVKRYSSGMYVRLAFAVAAHLEPEILIIDEVLAVGDATYQRRCIDRMSELASEGRTVLFVSHNMDVIPRLCRKAILLERGRIVDEGPARPVVERYLSDLGEVAQSEDLSTRSRIGDGRARFTRVQLIGPDGQPRRNHSSGQDFTLQIDIASQCAVDDVALAVTVKTLSGARIISGWTREIGAPVRLVEGHQSYRCRFRGIRFRPGHLVSVSLWMEAGDVVDFLEDARTFEVIDGDGTDRFSTDRYQGVVLCNYSWERVG